MQSIEESIIKAFKKNKGRDLKTSELVKFVYSEEYSEIDEIDKNTLFFQQKRKIMKLKAEKKKKLHKRILYHLHRLESMNILRLKGITDFGEKIFGLNETGGDLIINLKKERIIIHDSVLPSLPIENFLTEKIVRKYSKNYWITKVDAILLNAEKTDSLQKILEDIIFLRSYVDDTIGIYRFDNTLCCSDTDKIDEFITGILEITSEYNIRINFIVDLDFGNNKNTIYFFKTILPKINNNIYITLSVSEATLQTKKDFLINVFEEFIKNKIKININNKKRFSSPIFNGKAGIYSLTKKEWDKLKKENPDIKIAVISASTLILDLESFHKKYKTLSKLNKFIENANKSFLIANVFQRKISNNYFHKLIQTERNAFAMQKNYLRIWNYNFNMFEQKKLFFEIMHSIKNNITNFAKAEETIYTACGMPIRFKIELASAFKKSDITMSLRSYKKKTIKNKTHFLEKSTKENLYSRSKLFKIFDFNDRIRFFREIPEQAEDLIEELEILFDYSFSIITFDFAKLIGNLKLNSFIKNGNN